MIWIVLGLCGACASGLSYALWGMETAFRVLTVAALGIGMVYLLRGRRVKAGAFARETKAVVSNTDFGLVAANPEAKRSLAGLASYLREPEKYRNLGARMPSGVLLYGPPGTGKTLLARALAGEAGVPFYAMSGSDFVEMYAGVGASRVRALFRKARESGRAVIFIDEIDAMGKKRGSETSDERDQTLNALLSEMSGFRGGEGVLVLAATNRLDALDPALLRPGRFDRRIEVGLPGKDERLEILQLHARDKRLAGDVKLDALARDTVCFSGASLECLLNEAAIKAAERGATEIESEDVQSAYIEAVAGANRENARMTDAEKRFVAAHEAGHAVATRLLAPEKALRRVTILPTTRGAAGYNLAISEEKNLWTRDRIFAEIDILLAGRAAEETLFGADAVTSGAGNDLTRAAELAASAVAELGFCGEPAVSARALSGALGASAGESAEKCRKLLSERYQSVVKLLSARADALRTVMGALLCEESIEGETVDACLREAGDNPAFGKARIEGGAADICLRETGDKTSADSAKELCPAAANE